MTSRDEEDDIFEQDTEEWMEKKRAEHIKELKSELTEVTRALQFAAGFINSSLPFHGKHLREVVQWLIAGSKIGRDT